MHVIIGIDTRVKATRKALKFMTDFLWKGSFVAEVTLNNQLAEPIYCEEAST